MSEHIPIEELKRYLLGELKPDELTTLDSHIGKCEECRQMAVSQEDFRISAAALEHALSAKWPSHLSYDEIEGLVDLTLQGGVLERAEAHFKACHECREEVDNLREFAKPTLLSLPDATKPLGTIQQLQEIFSTRHWMVVPAFGAVAIIAISAWFLMRQPQTTDHATVADTPEPAIAQVSEPVADEPVITEPKPDVDLVPELALSLKDGGSTVGIDVAGNLAGYENPSGKQAELLRSALRSGTVAVGAEAKEIISGSGKRMGEGPAPGEESIRTVGPIGKVLDTGKPTFSWRPLGGAESYRVEIYDINYKLIASSGDLRATRWSTKLPRGRTYVWQVKGSKDGKEVRSSSAPETRFRTLDPARSRDLAAIRKQYPNSHLLLGLTYAEAGMIDEARREIEALSRQNPTSPIPRRLLANLGRSTPK